MTIVKESPIIQELLTQDRQLGFEEGREEGEYKGTSEALNRTLTIRFKVVSGEFQERFKQLDLQLLKQLHQVALTVQNLAEFEEALDEMLSGLTHINNR